MPPRGPSAYFLFAEEQREAVKAELQERDGKAGVAAVGKEIGARWQQLSDEEKQGYKDRAAQKAQELKEQQASAAAEAAAGSPQQVEEAAAAHEAQGGSSAPFGLPTSLVKRIVAMDPDVQRVSADGVRSIAKAAELFIQLLGARAFQHAAQQKRKNLRFQDIEAVAGRDRRLQEMGLGEFLATDAAFAEVHERVGEENQSKRGNRKQAEEPKGMRPLTAFFGGAGTS